MYCAVRPTVSKLSLKSCKNIVCSYVSHRWKHGFTVTTPIFYCNAAPHIGHLYTAVLADAAKRYHQMLECGSVQFITGTDEHGTKVERAAAANKMSPIAFCDQVSSVYQELFNSYEIDYTQYIRTTDENHINAVHNFWRRLVDNGHIYRGEYSGWYCIADEAFLPESQVKEISAEKSGSAPVKVSVESGQPVEWTTEENFKFKVSSFRDDLLHWLKDENVVQPSNFHKILCQWLHQDPLLEDLSVSRPVNRVPWGIKVPNNPEHTIYVWLDALVNYLTAAGYPDPNFKNQWPPTMQILGKDILKFHGIFWPAFLIAAGLEPPSQLIVHSHWTVDGKKMSKSLGNVVSPPSLSDGYSIENLIGMRYFLLRTGTPHTDNNFDHTLMKQVANSELAGALGNLLRRCCSKTINPQQIYPKVPDNINELDCQQFMTAIESLGDTIQPHYDACNFYIGVSSIQKVLHLANAFLTSMAPWKLTQEERQQGKQLPMIHVTMEALRVCGIALQPIVPSLASTLLTKLGVPEDQRMWQHLNQVSWRNGPSEGGYKLGSKDEVLFSQTGIVTKCMENP